MEVTDLKELKKLMKGDVSSKFEFVEDNDNIGSYNKNMMFSYNTSNNYGKDSMNNNGTYDTFKAAVNGNKYKDLSSDDSELQNEDEDYDNRGAANEFNDDYMYDEPTNQYDEV